MGADAQILHSKGTVDRPTARACELAFCGGPVVVAQRPCSLSSSHLAPVATTIPSSVFPWSKATQVFPRAAAAPELETPESSQKRRRAATGVRAEGLRRRRRNNCRPASPSSGHSSSASAASVTRSAMDPYWFGAGDGNNNYHQVNYTPTVDLTDDNVHLVNQPIHTECQGSQGGTRPNPQSSLPPKNKKRGFPKRMKNFSLEEDKLLVSAYLNVSKDPIVGINQPIKRYWDRITDYFHEHNASTVVRTLSSLQHRWGDISKDTSKFCALLAKIERRNQSGTNEDDKVKEAMESFERSYGGPFKFYHCWLSLKNEPKWSTLLATLNGPESSKNDGDKSSDNAEGSLPPKMERPMGRDRAKKQRSSKDGSSASSTACFEVLQKMSMDHIAYEERQEAANKEETALVAARAEKKLQIQQEEVMIQKEALEVQKQSLLMQERMMKLQETQTEERFMSADLDRMTHWQREYYMIKQQEIAEATVQQRRNSGNGGSQA